MAAGDRRARAGGSLRAGQRRRRARAGGILRAGLAAREEPPREQRAGDRRQAVGPEEQVPGHGHEPRGDERPDDRAGVQRDAVQRERHDEPVLRDEVGEQRRRGRAIGLGHRAVGDDDEQQQGVEAGVAEERDRDRQRGGAEHRQRHRRAAPEPVGEAPAEQRAEHRARAVRAEREAGVALAGAAVDEEQDEEDLHERTELVDEHAEQQPAHRGIALAEGAAHQPRCQSSHRHAPRGSVIASGTLPPPPWTGHTAGRRSVVWLTEGRPNATVSPARREPPPGPPSARKTGGFAYPGGDRRPRHSVRAGSRVVGHTTYRGA